jgi:hypothetical protein
MVLNGLTDVELVNLDAMYFVSFHRHFRFPSPLHAGSCQPLFRREGYTRTIGVSRMSPSRASQKYSKRMP